MLCTCSVTCTVHEEVYCWQLAFKNLHPADSLCGPVVTTDKFCHKAVVLNRKKNTVQAQKCLHEWSLAESCFMQIYGIQASCFAIVCLLTIIQPVFSDQLADKFRTVRVVPVESLMMDLRQQETKNWQLCSTVSRVENTYQYEFSFRQCSSHEVLLSVD